MSLTLLSRLTPTGNKTQLVRLLDVFVFGPLMIAAAAEQRSKYFRTALLLVGLGTIVYNGANYLQTAQQEKNAASLAGLAHARAARPGPRTRREGTTLH